MATKKATKKATTKVAPKAAGAHICPGRGAPCGTDLAPLIAKEPKDGQEHSVVCPRCATIHSFTAATRGG